jgi:small ligand-binding sensory domain FIST
MSDLTPRVGHASHWDWRLACELALAQISDTYGESRQARSPPASLHGLIYVSQALGEHFDQIVGLVSTLRPDVVWSGACVPGVLAGLGEYLHEPALALIAGDVALNAIDLAAPLEWAADQPSGLLIHADPSCADLDNVLARARQQLRPGALFGGVVAGMADQAGDPHPRAGNARAMAIRHPAQAWSRATLGARPLARPRLITSIRNRHLETLDHRPALEVLLEDLGVAHRADIRGDPSRLIGAIRAAIPDQGLVIGIAPPPDGPKRPGSFDQRICHLLGIEPGAGLVAIDDTAIPGEQILLMGLDAATARTDLIRACTELREELEASGRRARLLHYVSCVARGQALFGSAGVEASLIAHNLGGLPLIGFFANGEIGDGRLRGYSAVLTAIA